MSKYGPPRQDLWERVLRRLVISESTGCWEWQGAKDSRGYGRLSHRVPGESTLVHRITYAHYFGPIEDLTLDHLCRNTSCANPEHLEPVSRSENLRRRIEVRGHHNANKTHCKQGHEFSERNTAKRTGGGRLCKTCRQQTLQKSKERKNGRSV
jgi:hypothetical protein